MSTAVKTRRGNGDVREEPTGGAVQRKILDVAVRRVSILRVRCFLTRKQKIANRRPSAIPAQSGHALACGLGVRNVSLIWRATGGASSPPVDHAAVPAHPSYATPFSPGYAANRSV